MGVDIVGGKACLDRRLQGPALVTGVIPVMCAIGQQLGRHVTR